MMDYVLVEKSDLVGSWMCSYVPSRVAKVVEANVKGELSFRGRREQVQCREVVEDSEVSKSERTGICW